MSDESSAVKTLVQKKQGISQLEGSFTEDLRASGISEELKLSILIGDAQEKAEKATRSYIKDCPLLYTFCAQNKRTVDSNCIGDYEKFSGCHTFIELGLTAPPKTSLFYDINWEKNVAEQLRKIKKTYKTLENNCITREKATKIARKRYEKAEKNFQIFKDECGPKP